jgi:hypothetical protein
VVKNSVRYWCADPFIIEENDKVYIFFEAYDRFTNKGSIGYREVNGNVIGKMKIIINEQYHLSYPFIYFDNGSWYMIPESGMSNKIIRYKAKRFPDLWEKEKVLIDSIPAVDTTVFSYDGYNMRLFTYIQDKSFHSGELKFINLNEAEGIRIHTTKDLGGTKRPAGRIYEKDGILYRPSQLCTNFYGEAIIINKIISVSNDCYSEEDYKIIRAEDIRLNPEKRIQGIHTYNSSDNLEVIDIQTRKINIISFIATVYKYILGKIIK